ncbi:glycerophosphodiester phosphodiesterase, partial [Streptococcus pneumoniae]|nr:glycerophosphodiester phosphodiesterase [Streptococcus pneumoniae]
MFPPARVSAAGPVIVAHRGSRLTAPENSMAAFKAAYAAGLRHIEMDLQVNAAGQCVVMHDTTVARTCAG